MTQLHYPEITLDALPASMAAMYPGRNAVVDGDRVLSYTELDHRTAAVAAGLHRAGVDERDVIALHLDNSIEFVLAYYGALRAGATVSYTHLTLPTIYSV